MSKASHNIRLRPILWIVLFCFGLLISTNGQQSSQNSNTQAATAEKDTVIKIGVDEVRLDAVVVDRNGRQITDLTADDFEIYQDGKPQKIIYSKYITDNQAPPGKQVVSPKEVPSPSPTLKGSRPVPPISSPPLKPEQVRRTIVFLVDDLSMTFEDVVRARASLRKFVVAQMLPGDLVAIMQTKGWSAGLQPFSSDRKQLLAMIDTIRYSVFRTLKSRPVGIPQIYSVPFCIQALQDMPGRKFLLILSPQVLLSRCANADIFNRLADAALRAGVVIHTLDMAGVTIDLRRSDGFPLDAESSPTESIMWLKAGAPSLIVPEGTPTIAETQIARARERILLNELPLSQKTGGLFLTGNNFFAYGIGDVAEQMKGYYLLSYIPPPDTFRSDDQRIYHKIRIKVKRPGCEVRARDGFYGSRDVPWAPVKDQNFLIAAMFSPFKYNDLKLNLASGYIDDPQKGYMLRAWLHLDGKRLTFKGKDRIRSISLEAVAVTSDIKGVVQDSGNMRIAFPVGDEDIQWIREHGLKFSLLLPAKRPGSYYVRAAVKDLASGTIGSAYQFLEIPDLKKDGLSLSSIFIVNRDEDATWIQSGVKKESQSNFNLTQQSADGSRAFRIYQPGEEFDYAAVIYNAKGSENLKPDLEYQFVLYKDGSEIVKSLPASVDTRPVNDFGRIPIRRRLMLDSSMQPGNYTLQLVITDKRAKENSVAAQTLEFEIAAKTLGPEITAKSSATKDSQAPLIMEWPAETKNKTVIEMTPEEIRRFDPELSRLKFTERQDELAPILEKVGDRVVAFFRDFSNTASKERIDLGRIQNTPEMTFGLYKLIPVAKNMVKHFNYFILPGSGKPGISWVEDRADKENRSVNQEATPGFIMSSGYAGLCIYLHPTHQPNSFFRYLGRERRKPYAHVIAFAQKPESGDYLAQYSDMGSMIKVRYTVQGFVWIDPENDQIIRIRTSMLQPEKEGTLEDTMTDVRYEKVLFDNPRREFWLPKEVNVRWKFPNWTYFNRHQYSDYHLFSVESGYKITKPQVN